MSSTTNTGDSQPSAPDAEAKRKPSRERHPHADMSALDHLLAPLRETAASAARLVKDVATRLDAMSLDLARDGGSIVRNAKAFGVAVRDEAIVVRDEVVASSHQARKEAVLVGTEVRDAAVAVGAEVREVAASIRDEIIAAHTSAVTSASTFTKATPRVAKIASAAAALFARQRWLRLAQAARTGETTLRPEDHRDLAARTAGYAAELRGGIAKIGQLASCRPDLVGPIWAGELAKLQDEVPPVDAAAIRARIESELGKPIGELFADFSDEPIAAASLAQVHAATLLDGTRVVVKVQVPGIEDVIAADIAALRAIASTVGEVPGVDLPTLTSELARALEIELDYAAEATALKAYGGSVVVPKPIRAASSSRILTMTRIDGERLTAWLDHATPETRDALLGELVSEVAAQILVRGQVHGDPHPGNFLVVTGEGAPELALLDFGCMLDLSKEDRAAYARLVLAIAGANNTAAAKELAALGFTCDDPDQLVALTGALIGAMKPGMRTSDIDWQSAFADQIAQAKQLGGLTIPRSFVLLGRVLASIAGLLATYKPKIEIHPLIARQLAAAIAAK